MIHIHCWFPTDFDSDCGKPILECKEHRSYRLQNPPKKSSVVHPDHYNSHPSGIECIDVVQHMGFNIGNAIKYLWRADLKGNAIEDLHKARQYIDFELKRRGNG